MEQVSLDTGYVILAKQYDFDICQIGIKMSWDWYKEINCFQKKFFKDMDPEVQRIQFLKVTQ